MGHNCSAKKLSILLSKDFEREIIITPQQLESVKNITRGSNEAMDIVLPHVQRFLKQSGLHKSCAVVEGPCKKLKRFFAKAIGKHDGDINKVPDVGRLRILIEKPEDVIAIRKLFLGDDPKYTSNKDDDAKRIDIAVRNIFSGNNPKYTNNKDDGVERIGIVEDRHPTNNIAINEFEDYYHVPSSTGRMGIHISLNVTISGKQTIPFEIQVLHKDMVITEDFTRNNYLRAQEIERRAKNEGRPETEEEKMAIENYDNSSKERYIGDALRYNLVELRRSDLAREIDHKHLKPRLAELAFAG